jgi:acetyl esterase/lipase
MAQIAASVEYEAARPPDGLPDDMQALPAATLRFLSIKAIDGFKIQAALWQPDNKPPTETSIIVQVHGSGGNLASLPLRVIARALSARGYAALSISTRQHDEHVNTDNFFDVRRDIEAAVVTAKALGYRSIVRQGHSLGTMQVVLCRHRLGPYDQRRHPDRRVREITLEVTAHPGPGRGEIQSIGSRLA